ncbi:MAG: DUF5329 domain-containing protein [Pseudomonadota bacterium]
MSRPGSIACLLGILLTTISNTVHTATDQEINALLHFVASSGCVFMRNGDSYEASRAADHLRLKYQRGQRYIDTADQFIDRLASESSWTGKPYTVQCGQQKMTSREWLHDALAALRQQTPGK